MSDNPQAARTLKSIAEHLDMTGKEKSCLDDVPTRDTPLPLVAGIGGTTKELGGGQPTPAPSVLSIVSYCQNCSSPIYAPHTILPGQVPTVIRSCACLP